MRYIIAAATAFALVAGIALGFIVSRGLDGSASAAPPPKGPVTVVAQDVSISAGDFVLSSVIDTADCTRLAVFADHNGGSALAAVLRLSADETTVSGRAGPGAVVPFGSNTVTYFLLSSGSPVVAPKVAVELKHVGTGSPIDVTKAWLFCSP